MATLREQLVQIYPKVLPIDPKDAKKGTELLALVKPELNGDYADHTIRQHFSEMSADPTSAIAKVSQGYGYYLRSAPAQVASDAAAGSVADTSAATVSPDSVGARNLQREEKFSRVISAV